ncbi:MAG: hypothetical protein NTX75_13065 [Proteobacteria bacterium]|nr:hypothetical protein [Pseudomonadota bacterium]
MNLSELNDLWNTQRQQYKIWFDNLNKQAATLRNEVWEILQPTLKEWTSPENGPKRSYVELHDISEKPQPVSGLGLTSKSLTDMGELIFGIAITFEPAPNAFPKTTHYMPVAVRFINKAPQFSFFDKTSGRPDSKWEQDIKIFANTLVDEMIKHLSFNPLDGPRTSSRIGFL